MIAALRHAVDDGHPAVVIDADLGVDVAIAPPIAATIYYCCLEAINNARRHAQPDTITLRVSRSDGRLRFTVTDDGIGYDTGADRHRSAGRGLRNVRARLATVGGHLNIHSQPGRGTTVDAAVPLAPRLIGPADDAPPDVGSPRVAPRAALGGGRLIDRVRDADPRCTGALPRVGMRAPAARARRPARSTAAHRHHDHQPAAVPAPAATDPSPRPSGRRRRPWWARSPRRCAPPGSPVDVVELTPPARPTPRGGDERADSRHRGRGLGGMPRRPDGRVRAEPALNIGDDNPDRTADTLAADAAAGFPAARPPTFRVLTRPGLATAAQRYRPLSGRGRADRRRTGHRRRTTGRHRRAR